MKSVKSGDSKEVRGEDTIRDTEWYIFIFNILENKEYTSGNG
jgi:hypothetical protein